MPHHPAAWPALTYPPTPAERRRDNRAAFRRRLGYVLLAVGLGYCLYIFS